MATEIESGFSAQQISPLESSELFSSCYGWKDLDNVFLAYPQGTEAAADLSYYDDSQFAPGEKDCYGLSGYDIYSLSSVLLVNDYMINEIVSSYSERLQSVSDISDNEVIIVSLDGNVPFQIGENLPLFTAYGTPDSDSSIGYDVKYAERFSADICDIIYIDDNNSLLYEIFEKNSSDYLVLFSSETAQNLNLPYQNFDDIYLKYNDGTTDNDTESLISSVYTVSSYMSAKTMTDCINNYRKSMIKEYIITFTVFGLMILLSLIGYYQTLSLQIQQKTDNIRNLRAIGMSKKSLRSSIYQ